MWMLLSYMRVALLQAFMTFAGTADAVAASTEMIESKMGKSLKKFLTKNIVKKELKDKVGAPESGAYGRSLLEVNCCRPN